MYGVLQHGPVVDVDVGFGVVNFWACLDGKIFRKKLL
jgi:hypothetical protein